VQNYYINYNYATILFKKSVNEAKIADKQTSKQADEQRADKAMVEESSIIYTCLVSLFLVSSSAILSAK
jgi:hypothetical protein